jgi:hypothetical protein
MRYRISELRNSERISAKFHGKQVALENDTCIRKCGPPPRLIASQRTASMSFNTGELTAMDFKADGRPMARDTGAFDEQVRAVGHGVSNGYPSFIRAADGRTIQGRLDASGTLPRVSHPDRRAIGMGKAENITGADWESKVKGRTGIIMFDGYWARSGESAANTSGGHIDLWNKDTLTPSAEFVLRFRLGITRFRNPLDWAMGREGNWYSDLSESKRILFWEVK